MATLKISDLSVGDWFRYNEEECTIASIYMAAEGYPHEVALTHQGICSGLAYIDYLEPIPITPEILEANGFVYNGVGQHYLKCGNGITVRVGRNPLSHDDCWLVATDKQVDETISTTCVLFDARHIHQLQHALRLAGVDREIVMPNK